jgi:hypothetical protein
LEERKEIEEGERRDRLAKLASNFFEKKTFKTNKMKFTLLAALTVSTRVFTTRLDPKKTPSLFRTCRNAEFETSCLGVSQPCSNLTLF